MPGVSCHFQLGRFRAGIETKYLFALGFKQELNSVFEVGQTFFLGLALTICAGHFQAGRPKPAFTRFAAMQDGCQLLHGLILACPVDGAKGLFALAHSNGETSLSMMYSFRSGVFLPMVFPMVMLVIPRCRVNQDG